MHNTISLEEYSYDSHKSTIIQNNTLSSLQKKKLITEKCYDNEMLESIKIYDNKIIKNLVWSIFIRFNSMGLIKFLNLITSNNLEISKL